MLKLLAFALCVLLCILLIKDKSPAFAALLGIGGCCAVFAFSLGEIKDILLRVKDISSAVSTSAQYISVMIKVLLISLLTQVVSDICRDNGENALAGITETAAKAVVIGLVLPVFETVITIVGKMIK